jgi:hypothetical protein
MPGAAGCSSDKMFDCQILGEVYTFKNEPHALLFINGDPKFCLQLPEMLKDPFGRKKRMCLRRTLTGPW